MLTPSPVQNAKPRAKPYKRAGESIGPRPIGGIDAPELLAMLRKMVTRGTLNSAERARDAEHDLSLRHRHGPGQARPRRSPHEPVRA